MVSSDDEQRAVARNVEFDQPKLLLPRGYHLAQSIALGEIVEEFAGAEVLFTFCTVHTSFNVTPIGRRAPR